MKIILSYNKTIINDLKIIMLDVHKDIRMCIFLRKPFFIY
jgi:hypothetical protein